MAGGTVGTPGTWANVAASLGLSLAGGVNLSGALGVGGIPAGGFGPGTPLYGGPAGGNRFFSDLTGIELLTPASRTRAPMQSPQFSRGFTEWMFPRSIGAFNPFVPVGPPTAGGLVNLLSSSGGFNDPVFTNGGGGWGGSSDWLGSLLGGVTSATFGYLQAKQQTKMLNALAKLRLNTPTFGTPLNNPLAGIGGLGAGLGSGLVGGLPFDLGGLSTGGAGAAAGGVLGGEIGGPIGAGIGGALGGLAGLALGGSGTATRTPHLVGAWNQQTQRGAFYRYVGRPVLFQGDITNLKRTRKVLRRFAVPAGIAAGCRRRVRRRR